MQHFIRMLSITTPAELREVDHKAVIARERYMRETEHAASSTIRRRLAALSGRRDSGTTKLYDRSAYNPEKAARLFATY